MRYRSTRERFWSKVDRSGSCWIWTASIRNGYGQFGVTHDEIVYAHRFAYELLVGPIPDGLQLDHLCRNRACVRPSHLEPVTQRENMRRGNGWSGRKARQTHCINGHEFTPENTRLKSYSYRAPKRECRACDRERASRERAM